MANIRYAKYPKNQKVLQTSENQLYHGEHSICQTSEKQLFQGKHPMCQTSEKPKSAAKIRKAAFPWQTSDVSNIRKTKNCSKHPKTSFIMANIRYAKYPKNQKVLQTSENQLYHGEHSICQTSEKQLFQGKHPICQTSEKPKSAAKIRKAAFPWQTSDVSNIRKTKNCSKLAKTSLTRANIRYVKHLKNQKVLQTSENQLYHGEHPICQISEKPKSAANIRKAAFPGQTSDMSDIRKTKKCCIHAKTSFTRAKIRYVKHPKKQKVLQTSEKQLFQGKHPMCQTSEKPKCGANKRKPALPGQTSDMSNIRKTKKCCKHPKTGFSRANIRYVRHPKKQKVLHTCENQLYQGKDPICQTSEKTKSAANIRKAAFPGQTSDVSNIRKTKMWCKQAKTSFIRANIRYVKHPKNQKVLQVSENQLYHGKHPICQTSEKPKSAANIRKAAFPGQTSDMSDIRKNKKCCIHAKTSFTRAKIRYVKHPKKQKVLQTSEKQLFQGKHPMCQTSEKPKCGANKRKPALSGQTSDMSNIRKTKKCCKYPKTSFIMANIRYAKHPKNQKVLQTSEKQLFQGKLLICQSFEKPKSAAIMQKPALPGQTSDISYIRKTKKCCKHPKTGFSRANIRYVRHPKKQKVLHTCENQLYQGKDPICQTSEKTKSAANIRKAAFPGQTSDVSNIRKTKMWCKQAKTSFIRANIRYVKHPKNQKVLQVSENQLYHGKHPICQTSEKPKSAANIRKAAFPGQTSDMSDIRKNKKCCIHAKTSFTRAKIRYVKHPKKQKVLQTSEKQLFQGKHPMCQTSEKPKCGANKRKPALSGQTSDMSNIRKTKKCCKYPKTSFIMANIRYAKHPKNQKVLQTSEKQLFQGKLLICQSFEKPKSAAIMQKPALPGQTSDISYIRKTKKCCKHAKTSFTRANTRYVKHSKTKKCCKHPKSSFSRANIRYFKHPKNQKLLQLSENQL